MHFEYLSIADPGRSADEVWRVVMIWRKVDRIMSLLVTNSFRNILKWP